MNPNFLDFEQPIAELEGKIEELRLVGTDNEINISSEEIENLRAQERPSSRKRFTPTSVPWQIVKVARHPRRPYTLDYIRARVHRVRRVARRPPLSPTTMRSSVAWPASMVSPGHGHRAGEGPQR
jgi:acetyl-CoA carboxylase alpha subunit